MEQNDVICDVVLRKCKRQSQILCSVENQKLRFSRTDHSPAKKFLAQKINKLMQYTHTKIRFGRQMVCSHILTQKTKNIQKIAEFRNSLLVWIVIKTFGPIRILISFCQHKLQDFHIVLWCNDPFHNILYIFRFHRVDLASYRIFSFEH